MFVIRNETRGSRLWLLATLLLAASITASGAEPDDSDSLTGLSIEALMDIEVSLVSRMPERLALSPAAVYVITRDDIERSPALSVPELLRNVPGVHVARIDASKWSITIRGFSGQLANKLQVLVDGRSIFTPVFSGVTWEDQFMPLNLIERIEVIRGPGGATWGANAVNGIINIITRSAAESQGGELSLSAGTELESLATLTYGGRLTSGSHYRAYLHELGMNPSEPSVRGAGDDDWRGAMAGLRWDGVFGDDELMVQLDGMENRLNATLQAPLSFPSGGPYFENVTRDQSFTSMTRWTRTLSETSELAVQASFHHYESDSRQLGEWRNTLNFDMQHHFEAGLRHEITWGLGVNYYYDHMTPRKFISISPSRRRYRLFSAFVQDQIRWLDDRLSLTAGARAEYSDQAGFHVQPSLRLAWTPKDSETTLWAAVSRAVNTPSRSEFDGRLDLASIPLATISFAGNGDFKPEELMAYEMGLRSRLRKDLVVDVALFYNDYDRFRSAALKLPYLDLSRRLPSFVFPIVPENNAGALARGVEIALEWEPSTRWRTRLGWSYLNIHVQRHSHGFDPITPNVAGDTPAHQVFWQNHFDFPNNVALDFEVRHVAELEGLGVDEYTTLDIRAGWKPRDDLLIEIVGQNLLEPSRKEFDTNIISYAVPQIERGVYGSVTWKF